MNLLREIANVEEQLYARPAKGFLRTDVLNAEHVCMRTQVQK